MYLVVHVIAKSVTCSSCNVSEFVEEVRAERILPVTTPDMPATAVVHLDGQTHTVAWPRGEKLLDVLLDKGIEAPYSCREGHCGACATTKLAGDVEMEVNDVLEPSDLDEGLILGCQAKPVSNSVEVTYDE